MSIESGRDRRRLKCLPHRYYHTTFVSFLRNELGLGFRGLGPRHVVYKMALMVSNTPHLVHIPSLSYQTSYELRFYKSNAQTHMLQCALRSSKSVLL